MRCAILLTAVLVMAGLCVRPEGAHYDKSRVPDYVLPDPLQFKEYRIEGNRGGRAFRWAIPEILARGSAYATWSFRTTAVRAGPP